MKLLIIGGGAIADCCHIPSAIKILGIESVYLAEPNTVQADKLRQKHGLLNVVQDYREPLADVDACIICTPPHVRNEILKECIAVGKHILCEKPLSPSSSETTAILQSASKNLVIGMCHTYRFHPTRKEARRLIQSGFFGESPTVTINEGGPSNWPNVSGYCFKKELVPGGALYDNGIHSLDFLLWCFGEPDTIDYEDDAMGGLESNLSVKMRFGKAKAFYKLSRTMELSNTIVIEGNGHKATLGVFDTRKYVLDGKEKICEERVDLGVAQLRNFLDAIDGKEEISCSVYGGLEVIKVLEQCYSQKSERVVEPHPIGGFEGKTVFVTGGTGFIGSHLVEQLVIHEKAKVKVLVHNWGRAAYVSRFDVEFIKANILDEDAMTEAMAGCDFVFHFAIVGGVETNVRATESILGAAKKCGVKYIVQMSSVVVHGETVPENLTADSPLVPYDDVYALSKLESEKRFWELLENYDLHGSIVRPTYVWGPYSKWYTIFPLEQMRKGEFAWVDKGKGICNAVYVGNVVDLCLTCCINSKADHHAFIAKDAEIGNWRDFFSPLIEMMGMNPDSFPSIPLKVGIWRKFRLAWMRHLWSINAKLVKKIDATEPKNPLKAKLFYRMPRKLFRQIRKIVEYRLPEMAPDQMAIYSQSKAIDVSKNKDILEFKPRYTVKQGQEITLNWLRFSDIYIQNITI